MTNPFPIEKCQKLDNKQGALYVGPSDNGGSVGYLELSPHTSLPLHNRPVLETLTQIKGSSDMISYDEDGKAKVVTLRAGDTFTADAGVWHIHANPYETTSLQYWEFNGDITPIISAARDQWAQEYAKV